MYEELIKRLHRYSENCVAYKLDADFADAVQQAADAIEELSRENESLAKSVNEASEILRKCWIPVTERLPDMHMVHSEYGCGDYMISDAVAIYAIDLGETPEVFCGMYEKDLGEDGFEGWTDCEGNPFNTVTHWMPLPEPPKEGA